MANRGTPCDVLVLVLARFDPVSAIGVFIGSHTLIPPLLHRYVVLSTSFHCCSHSHCFRTASTYDIEHRRAAVMALILYRFQMND